jgi:hypothetical protein
MITGMNRWRVSTGAITDGGMMAQLGFGVLGDGKGCCKFNAFIVVHDI